MVGEVMILAGPGKLQSCPTAVNRRAPCHFGRLCGPKAALRPRPILFRYNRVCGGSVDASEHQSRHLRCPFSDGPAWEDRRNHERTLTMTTLKDRDSNAEWSPPIQPNRSRRLEPDAAAPALNGRWIGDAQLPEWDALVQRHSMGTVFHLSGWKAAMEEALSHVQGRFYGLFDAASGELVGGLPLCIVRSWLLGKRVVSVPYGTLNHPLLNDPEDLARIRGVVDSLQREVSAREACIRVRGSLPGMEDAGFRAVRSTWNHYLPLTEEPEKLKKNFSRTNVRQWIQRAEKAGLTVERLSAEHGIPVFYPMFVNTRRRLGLPWVPRKFFEAIYHHLAPRIESVFVAKSAGLPLAAVLTFQFKDMLSLEALGETDAAHKTGAVQLIYWTAIQTAHHEGQRVVSFGQTEKDNEGLARHKRGWGCLEETLTDYRYLPDSAKGSLSEIHSAGKRRLRPVFRKLPVWAGSMLSKFLYHHLG